MPHEDGDLSLTVGGRTLSGWQQVRVTRGIERVPNDFDIAFTERFPGESAEVSVKPGDPCEVKIGSDLVITGYVDRFGPRIDRNTHTLRCNGRSKSQDMVDCAAEWPGGQISGANALAIAQKLAQPYGITVTGKGDAGPAIPQFNLTLGETAFMIVERVGRFAAQLCYDTSDGNMEMSQVGTESHASGFKEGENVKRAEASFSMDQRFSEYLCYLQSMEVLGDIGEGGNLLSTEKDPNVSRHRRRVIIAEAGAGGLDVSKKRNQWEAARRAGRSSQIAITADSWRDSAGKLWTPNMLAPIDIPSCKLTGKKWIIGQVALIRGEEGTEAELMLMPPEAFKPEPILLQPIFPDLAG